MHYTTIDPKSQRFGPTIMYSTTIDPTDKDSNPRSSTTFMVIEDVTAHINPKHLYRNDEKI
jgi:hypothetical protein